MFTIYTKPNCKYCTLTKSLINIKGDEYTEKVVGEHVTKEELLEIFPNAKTVPQILKDGKPIGGYEDLREYYGNQ